MDYIPELYKKVEVGTYQEAPCSPAIPSSCWSGIIITAPKSIILEENERLVVPVCGYYLVPVLSAMDDDLPLSVHVRLIDSKNVLSGAIIEEGENEPDEPLPDDAPSLSKEDFEDVLTGGYFNIDVQHYLKDKLMPGVYEVVVTYAGVSSNIVQLEIISK